MHRSPAKSHNSGDIRRQLRAASRAVETIVEINRRLDRLGIRCAISIRTIYEWSAIPHFLWVEGETPESTYDQHGNRGVLVR
jgi:hypothetical protein